MLLVQPEHRITAEECLRLELEDQAKVRKNYKMEFERTGWLKQATVGDHKMNEQEFQDYQKSKKVEQIYDPEEMDDPTAA